MLVTGNFRDEVEGFLSLSKNLTPSPQEAVALATLVKEQLQYQVLPRTEIPVLKSLLIPMGATSSCPR